MKPYILIMLLLFIHPVLAQRNMLLSPEKQLLAKGKEYYEKGNYAEAITSLKQALARDSTNIEANYYLGMSYMQTNEEDSAIPLLEYYTTHYTAHKSSVIEKHKAMYRLHYLREQKKLLQAPMNMKEPVKLPEQVNSPYPDYAPVMDATGTRLYFTSTRLGGISAEPAGSKEGDEDAYYTDNHGKGWGKAQLLPAPINSSVSEGIASFSADGQFMVMVACSRENSIGQCDLYYSELKGDQWSELQNMGEVVNSIDWDSQPTISFDGNRIIFISARVGGYGEIDLYMVEKNPFGDWGPAMNLGAKVNTPFTEHSPFLVRMERRYTSLPTDIQGMVISIFSKQSMKMAAGLPRLIWVDP